MRTPSFRFTALLGLFAVTAACDRTPGDLREWTPADHDHTTNPNDTQVQVQPDGGSPLARFGIDEVTLVAWKQNCVRCHGNLGAGDGPQGPMTRARDLTDPAWQAGTSDEAMARSIREGKGVMPAFQLPDTTVQTLVRLVRLFNAERLRQAQAGAAETAGSAAPEAAGSAAPGAAAPSAGAPTRAPVSAPKPAPGR